MKFSFREGKQHALETFLVAPGGGAIPATSIFHNNILHMVGHLFRTNPHLYPRVRGGGGWGGQGLLRLVCYSIGMYGCSTS